jgi:hypothetical protein
MQIRTGARVFDIRLRMPESNPDSVSPHPKYRNPWAAFFSWTAAIYLPAFFSFLLFVSPQGIETSLRWQALFLLPSLFVASIGTVVLWNSSVGRLGGALLGGTIGFLTSSAVSFVGCRILVPRGEADAWYAIPFLPVVFFATLSGTIFGAIRLSSGNNDSR